MTQVDIVLFGGGGGAVEIARYITDSNRHSTSTSQAVVTDLVDEGTGRVDDLEHILGHSISVHSDISTVKDLADKQFLLTLGNNPLRHDKFAGLKAQGVSFHTVIHPSAQVPESARVGEGCVISPFSLVGEFARLDANTFVNVRCTIGHDARIGSSSILSPHAVLGGSSQLGDAVYLGSGAIVNPGVHVGSHSKVSSGAVVNSRIEAGCVAFGNPAKGKQVFDPATGHSRFAARS